MFYIQFEDELFSEGWLKCFATEILDANYERTHVVDCERTHASERTSKHRFALSATGNKKMFDGTLGVFPHK